MNSLLVYRELSDPSPTLITWLDARDQLFVVVDPKGVEHSYVDNDTPRDSDITDEMVGGADTPYPGCTKGFALFTIEGDYVASYSSVVRAEEAKANARIVTSAVVEGDKGDLNAVGWNSLEGDGTEDEPE